MTLEICFFRHGRTTWNAQGRFQGQAESDLDELGRAQAKAVGERAAAMAPKALFSSDLRRCQDVSAEIALRADVAVQLDVRLRECDFGHWSGKTRTEIRDLYPTEYASWISHSADAKPHQGESRREVCARVDAFLADIRRQYNDGVIVAVSHGSWITTCAQYILGVIDLPRRIGAPTQGSLTVLGWHDDAQCWRLESYNERGHLYGVEPEGQFEEPAPSIY